MATSRRFVAKNGLDNNNNSITNLGVSGASLTRVGAHALTLTTSGATNITFPALTATAITTGDTGTVTNAMLAGSIALTKLTSDTTTALGVGTIELGHASDTTLARSAAGQVTIEGVQVLTQTNTVTGVTNKSIALGSNTVTGTKANFNTACTDDDFAYLATANVFTALQESRLTTEQLRLSYSASVYHSFQVQSSGGLYITGPWINIVKDYVGSGGWVLGTWTQAAGVSNYAYLACYNLDHTQYGNYALIQDTIGNTRLNSPATLTLNYANSTRMTVNSTGIGFYSAAAVAQPTTAGAAATFVANTGTAVNDASTFDGYTIKQVVKALRNLGLLA